MRTRCRRFLLLLLMFALPVQAWAAASMLDCALGERTGKLALAVAAATPVDHAHHGDPLDHGGHAMNAVDPADGCHQPSGPAPVSDNAHECQHCATCLLGATLPVPVAPMPLGLADGLRYAALADAALALFFPDGPERPPRSRLA